MTAHDIPPSLDSLLSERTWVRALARGLVASESDVDDVEQETWLAALRTPPRGPAAPRAWLATVVRNQARLLLRRTGRRRRFETSGARPEATASTADAVAHADALRTLVAALLATEEPYRATLLLRYFEGMPPLAIAARTGDPVGTVKTRLRRGLVLLRERLDRDEGRERRRALAVLLLAPDGRATPPRPGASTGAIAATKTSVLAAAAALVVAGLGSWWFLGGGATAPRPRESATSGPTEPRRSPPARVPTFAANSPPGSPAPAATANQAATGANREPLRRLCGTVVDEDTARGIADAVVRIANARTDGSEPSWESVGRTDAEGRFAVDGIPDRRCKVEIAAPGHRPFTGEIARGPLGGSAAFPLAAGRDLTVFVTGSDGAPLEGARVEYLAKWGRWSWTLRTDGDGAVARAGIEYDTGSVTVSSPGLADAELSFESGTGPVVERVQLMRTPAVTIEVGAATRDRLGAAAKWRFVVSPGWRRDEAHRLEATADARGVAELRGLPADRPSAIAAFVSLGGDAEAGPFDVATDVLPGRGVGPIRWELPGIRAVRVVCDGGGRASRVSASSALGADDRRRLEGEAARFQAGKSAAYPFPLAFSARGALGPDGAATLLLPPGGVVVRAFAATSARPVAEAVFTVDESTRSLSLTVKPRAVSIAGRVVGPDGAPMPHRAVQAWIDRKFDRWTETDDAGRFEFDSLPDGVYEVGARGVYDEIGGAIAESVRVPTRDLELRVGAVAVRGRVRDANGRRCSVALSKAYDAPGYVIRTWTDDTGAFELEAMSPGRWIVDALDGDRHVGHWLGEVPAGVPEFSFEIEPAPVK